VRSLLSALMFVEGAIPTTQEGTLQIPNSSHVVRFSKILQFTNTGIESNRTSNANRCLTIGRLVQ
jgi:hypothetical protein